MKLELVYNLDGTINIRDTVKKPSTALKLMCAGIKKQSKRKDFVVDMGTFGDYLFSHPKGKKIICYGCAATCTIQQLAGKNIKTCGISEVETRADILNFNCNELNVFECSIDLARKGKLIYLIEFFGDYLTSDRNKFNDKFFIMIDSDFFEQEADIKKVIKMLEKDGL